GAVAVAVGIAMTLAPITAVPHGLAASLGIRAAVRLFVHRSPGTHRPGDPSRSSRPVPFPSGSDRLAAPHRRAPGSGLSPARRHLRVAPEDHRRRDGPPDGTRTAPRRRSPNGPPSPRAARRRRTHREVTER